jgi:hypothetical protein
LRFESEYPVLLSQLSLGHFDMPHSFGLVIDVIIASFRFGSIGVDYTLHP